MNNRHVFSAIALAAAALLAQRAPAATYTIDEILSSMTLSVEAVAGVATVPLFGQDSDPTADPQGPDDSASRTSFLEGTIEATASSSLITLTTGMSVIDVKENANAIAFGGFLPAEGGIVEAGEDDIFADGTVDTSGDEIGDGEYTVGEDNFGFMATFFGVTGIAALRNFVFAAEGSGVPGAAMGGATGIGFQVSDGWAAFEFGSLAAPAEVSSITTGDPAVLNASGDLGYSLVGSLETITIPIDITISDLDPMTMNGFNLVITGTIVASRTVGTAGDFDGDTDIDGADFLLWQRGGTTPPLDPTALAAWEAGYGTGGALSAVVGSVPEPSSLVLIGLAMGLIPVRTLRTVKRRLLK